MACKVFHKGRYIITFKRGFEDTKKDITISINKVFESDTLKICLSDADDPTFLCILEVTRCDYEDLKKQQGLLIDFDNFPSQLVRLLQQCAANNMFLILHQANALQYYFEVVEHNEFKRLVHLSLKTGPATDADIKQHMAYTIAEMKKALSIQKNAAISSDANWSDKVNILEHKLLELKLTVTKMEDERLRLNEEHRELLTIERDKLVQERQQWIKNAESNSKAQLASSQELLNRKEKQIEELNGVCKQLKNNVSHLEYELNEKAQRLNMLEEEVQKSHIEVATLKAKNTSLEREVVENERKYTQLNSKCNQLEKVTKDDADVINNLNSSLQLAKKEKVSLEERLALCESLANRNNEAAHSTSEQLMKANQIISKQNNDLMEMKEKLLCRTAIALEQEKVIERNAKEMEDLKSEITSTKQTIEQLKKEFSDLRDKYELNEKALQDRDETIKNNNMVIQWLHKKMDGNCGPADVYHMKPSGIQSATSSTPYFLQKNNHINTSDPMSDESINFYATSKLSNIGENETTRNSEERTMPRKVGLDPKYLKPSDSEKSSKANRDSAKTKRSEGKNCNEKENTNFNLPKVDYREKKSSRPTSYRATHVSAYFP